MEIYADNLADSLKDVDQTDFHFKSYRPHPGSLIHHLPKTANLRMRAARYLSYPNQANKTRGDINHIMDHGYAHLMARLDPATTVLTVHDIIPILAGRGLIRGVTSQKRAHLAEWTARFYKKAARIIAISENTKRDLVQHCGCDERRIRVIYYGINTQHSPRPGLTQESSREDLDLPRNKYLVLITGREFYKNQSTSLKVMELLQKQYGENISLVRLGGESTTWRNLVKHSPFRRQVIQIDYLATEIMPELYNAVDCVLFPSWYEGFGLPPVEAMACGTPVVTSNVASLPEACGNAGVMAAPDDVKELANGTTRLLNDPEFRQSQIARGLAHAKQFDWEKNASQTLGVYRELN